jgi:hypothetical protein
MLFAQKHGERLGRELGIDPGEVEFDIDGVKAGFGLDATVDTRTYRDLQPGNLGCLIGPERPNVKDEPRWELARRVPHDDPHSAVSFRSSFGRTRRDRSQRWLWRLVRSIGRRPQQG